MINLTEFISKKLHNQPLKSIGRREEDKNIVSNRKNYVQQSFSSKSIGLSTILDLQNEEQNFGKLNISKIGNSSNIKNKQISRKESVKNAKDELQQMRQKRMLLQKRLNQTLTKQQINKNNQKYKPTDQNIIHEGEKFTIQRQSEQRQMIKCEESSKQIYQEISNREESLLQSKKIQLKQKQLMSMSSQSCKNSSSFQSQSFQQSYYLQLSNKSVFNHEKNDKFLNFLKKDIYTLKCQKLIHHVKAFKHKWLLKNLNQYIQLNKIVKRQEHKLCKFVFISWKRHKNEQNRKLIMAEMIRKRIQQKKLSEVSELVKNNNKHEELLENKQREIHIKQQTGQQQAIRYLTPQKIDQIRQNINNISKISLKQVSPIKPNRQQFLVPDHEISQFPPVNEISYYDQYSCITQNQQPQNQVEFIK